MSLSGRSRAIQIQQEPKIHFWDAMPERKTPWETTILSMAPLPDLAIRSDRKIRFMDAVRVRIMSLVTTMPFSGILQETTTQPVPTHFSVVEPDRKIPPAYPTRFSGILPAIQHDWQLKLVFRPVCRINQHDRRIQLVFRPGGRILQSDRCLKLVFWTAGRISNTTGGFNSFFQPTPVRVTP